MIHWRVSSGLTTFEDLHLLKESQLEWFMVGNFRKSFTSNVAGTATLPKISHRGMTVNIYFDYCNILTQRFIRNIQYISYLLACHAPLRAVHCFFRVCSMAMFWMVCLLFWAPPRQMNDDYPLAKAMSIIYFYAIPLDKWHASPPNIKAVTLLLSAMLKMCSFRSNTDMWHTEHTHTHRVFVFSFLFFFIWTLHDIFI